MRYTAENTLEVGRKVTAYLDGVEQHDCSEADTDDGYVICALRNEAGQIYTVDGKTVATETRRGVVRVETRPA